jgi:hypothetical protein
MEPMQRQNLATDQEISVIFSNVEEILPLHKNFVEDLETAMANFGDETLLGELFLKLVRKNKLEIHLCRVLN